jgi:predicted ArsR family transcriptional regulator
MGHAISEIESAAGAVHADPPRSVGFRRSSRDSGSRRREVLRVLRASSDPMSTVAIADILVVHPNTVRFHLDSLVGDGLVELVEPGRKRLGRPPLMFRAVRQMDRGGTRHYHVLAEILTKALAAEEYPRAKALAAGRVWGKGLANTDSDLESPPALTSSEEAIDRLVDVLDEFGFAPERLESVGEPQVGLHHCPFLELAESQTKVVCPLHLGLVQGVLEAWGAPITADRLDAFVRPDLCVLRLKSIGAKA